MIENLRSLAVLAAVVEEGSFRAAGAKLGLSPSVVSHHISNLEQRLDCAILFRTSRKLKLTQKGAILHQSAREMVAAVTNGLDAIQASDGQPCGTLRVAVPQVVLGDIFTQILQDYMSAHPKVNIEISLTSRPIHPVNDGYDLAISSVFPAENSVENQLLMFTEIDLFAAPDLARKLAETSFEEISQQMPLILSPGFSGQDWRNLFVSASAKGPSKLRFRFQCDDLSLAHSLCAAGKGLAVLPCSRVDDDLKTGRLTKVLPDLQLEPLRFYAVWPRAARATSLTRRFLDHILHDIGQQSDHRLVTKPDRQSSGSGQNPCP
ncbi:MAG: LysR family transcriptional regulator [Rhodobacteraceae bacterium]|nr:LysR family transcriptional regulator [Paracoccaceae bacterium]